MDPVQPPPVIRESRLTRAWDEWSIAILVVWCTMPLALLLFTLYLWPSGINITMDASTAARRVAPFILAVPMLVSMALVIQYLWRRARHKIQDASARHALAASVAVVLFWICSLVVQSHRDAVFQRNLEARLQPWAESILSRPRAEVLEKGRSYIREDLIPEFIGQRYIPFQTAKDSGFGANEDSIAIFYGVHQSVGGYVVGRKTLKIKEGVRRARKLKAGLYRFQDED